MFETTLHPPSLAIPMTGEHFLFKRSARGPGGVFAFQWTLAAGKKGPPEHVHDDETETFEIVSGTLHLWIGKDLHELRPGMRMEVQPGTPHRFFNPGKEPVVVEVTLSGTRMEDAMIGTVFHYAGRKPRFGELFRSLVHEADRAPSRPASGVGRAAMALIVGVARFFGARGFPTVERWEPELSQAPAPRHAA